VTELAVRIGRNIAAAREALGVSQRELARRVGASPAIASMWESGQHAPGAEFLLALSDALFVPVNALFGQQYADPETEQAVTWWAGYREGWRVCGENVCAAAALRPDRMPPRSDPEPDAEPEWMRAVRERQLRGGGTG
jgi:transcriptional regulator with XRE-family HTH domain